MKQFRKHEKADVTKLDFIMPLKVSQIDTKNVHFDSQMMFSFGISRCTGEKCGKQKDQTPFFEIDVSHKMSNFVCKMEDKEKC